MIPHNPPPNSGMGLVIPFPSAAHRSRPGADIRGTRGRFASIGVLERLLDFAAVMSAVLLCCRIYGWVSAHPQAGLPTISLINSAALFSLLFVLLLEKHGEYRPYLSLLAVRETERLLRVWIECFLVALPVAYRSCSSTITGNSYLRVGSGSARHREICGARCAPCDAKPRVWHAQGCDPRGRNAGEERLFGTRTFSKNRARPGSHG